MTDYIKLEAVLTRIPIRVRESESRGNLLSYALDLYKEINVPQKYETKAVILTVQDHKVKLPDDVRIINIVTYQDGMPTEEEACELLRCASEVKCSNCGNTCPDVTGTIPACSSCGYCLTEPENFTTRTNNICRHTLNYQLFLVSDYYANRYKPMKYIGTGSGICKKCVGRFNSCQYSFKVSPSRVLWTDLQEGLICVDYDAEVTEDGQILIPNNTKLIRAMAAYAEAMYWRNNRVVHEENSHAYYRDLMNEAEILLKSAKGNMILKAADAETIQDIIFVGNPKFQFTKVPEFYFDKND